MERNSQAAAGCVPTRLRSQGAAALPPAREAAAEQAQSGRQPCTAGAEAAQWAPAWLPAPAPAADAGGSAECPQRSTPGCLTALASSMLAGACRHRDTCSRPAAPVHGQSDAGSAPHLDLAVGGRLLRARRGRLPYREDGYHADRHVCSAQLGLRRRLQPCLALPHLQGAASPMLGTWWVRICACTPACRLAGRCLWRQRCGWGWSM